MKRVRPRLIAITDTDVAEPALLERRALRLARIAIPGSVLIQLRDLGLPLRARLELGRRIGAAAHEHQQYWCVNDRIDLALLLGADGVHLGERGILPADARALLGERAWISIARHDLNRISASNANAILLAPILAARKGAPPLGLEALRRARAILTSESGTLLYALGGIDAGNLGSCLEAGADGVAAIRAVFGTDAPERLLEALQIRAG
jgi:thiamine-phosphate pyrophosphorylase